MLASWDKLCVSKVAGGARVSETPKIQPGHAS